METPAGETQTGSPEQQLRAYVDYLRDMGVYDLYRRKQPGTLLPEALRERLAAVERTSGAAVEKTSGAAVEKTSGAAVEKTSGAAVEKTNGAAARTAAANAAAGGGLRPGSAPQRTLSAQGAPERAAFVPPSRVSSAPAQPAAEDITAAATSSLPPELVPPMARPVSFDMLAPLPAEVVPPEQRAAALAALRAEIGDCTRCPLAYAGRHTIVFGDGDANARLMFVGEGPGADEDMTGVPFVGKAGQLLNNMIAAMGLKREEVYIANIVKCRPPGNRTPEFVEATTCSQFLLRQIDIVRPEVIVALGATAATYLLGVRQSLASLRGQWHSVRGAKAAVTYHPAFLLRDPRQKGEAWKDLQRVMGELGLTPPKR